MKRPIAVCLAALICVGCRAPGQATDPFFGRSTVEPPRTGAVAGSRAPAYYSGVPTTTTPRATQVTTVPSQRPPAVRNNYAAPATRPSYGQTFTSSPAAPATNQRLIPATGPISSPSTLLSPTTIAPPATAVPAATVPATPAPAATAPATMTPINSAPLVPIDPQPSTGPTLRPAASIPYGAQGQCYPVYPRYSANPANASLAGRQRIVRPLQARESSVCPPGTVPVPCVPSYNPCVQGAASSSGAINLTDLPEPKAK